MSNLAAWSLAAAQSLTVYHEDVGSPEKPAQLEMIAAAVFQAAKETKGWPLGTRALIAAEYGTLENETFASLRIHRNECNFAKRECDFVFFRGKKQQRAISLFQLQAPALSDPSIWPQLGFMTFESTLLSAKEASRALVRGYRYCEAQKAQGNPIALMYSATAGRGCDLSKWQGWKPRLATYERVMRLPVPREAVATEDAGQKVAG